MLEQPKDLKIHFIWLDTQSIGLELYLAVRSAYQVYNVKPILWTTTLSIESNWGKALLSYVELRLLPMEWLDKTNYTSVKANKTDYLRLKVLEQFGGLYLDADTICVKSIFEISELSVGINVAIEHQVGLGDYIINAVIYVSEAYNEYIQVLILDCEKRMIESPQHGYIYLLLSFNDLYRQDPKCFNLVDSKHFYYYWSGAWQMNFLEDKDTPSNVSNELDESVYVLHYWGCYANPTIAAIDDTFLKESSSIFAKTVRKVLGLPPFVSGSEIIANKRSLATISELYAFVKYINETNGDYVVEIGTYLGGTTRVLASNCNLPIVTIDNYSMNTDPLDVYSFLSDLPNVIILVGSSPSIGKLWKGSIRFLLIDDGHEYDDVKADFENWLVHLSENSIVAFHDARLPNEPNLYGTYFSRCPGIERFVNELLQKDTCTLVAWVGSTAFLRLNNRSIIDRLTTDMVSTHLNQSNDLNIHFIWIGPTPVPMTAYMAIKSAVNIYGVRPYFWVHNLSEEDSIWLDRIANIAIIANLKSEWLDIVNRLESPVHMSDYLRMAILKDYGGLYLDTDIICIKSIFGIDGIAELTNNCSICWENWWNVICGAMIWVGMPNDITITKMVDIIESIVKNSNGPLQGYAPLGPLLITASRPQLPNLHVLDYRYVYAISTQEAYRFFLEEPEEDFVPELTKEMYFIHWTATGGTNKNVVFIDEHVDANYLKTSNSVFAKAVRLVLSDDPYITMLSIEESK